MKLIYTSILTILAIVSAGAQSPSKVLKQAEKALGGVEALRSVSSITKSGVATRSSDGVTGLYRIESARPNRLNTSSDVVGFEIETGFNGRSSWSRNSRDGLSTLSGASAAGFQASAEYRNNLWLNAKADKSKLTSGGRVKIDGKETNLVILTTAKGLAIKLYFDAVSGLPIRDELPGIDGTEIFDYSDYRNTQGIMQPYAIHLTTGEQQFDIKLEKIEIGASVSRSRFDFPVMSSKPLPDLAKLLSDLRANEERVEDILDSYAYTQKQTMRETGKDGNLRETSSETFQLSFYEGRRIRRLIEKNGKPLSPNDQASADKDAAKRVAEIEKEIEKTEAKAASGNQQGPPSDRGRRVSIAEILRASNLINPRRERFRGRDVIVFDFEPNPAFDLKNAQSMLKFFGKTAGVMWVDEEDKQVARIEAVLADNFNVGGGVLAKLRKGASFTMDQERINNEIWLPSQTDINMSIRVLLVKGLELNQVVKSYDYRKLSTEVKDAKVDEVKKP